MWVGAQRAKPAGGWELEQSRRSIATRDAIPGMGIALARDVTFRRAAVVAV